MNGASNGKALPWNDVRDIAVLVIEASRSVLANTALAHHLAKASVERWFAFELSFHLEKLLPTGWRCLVERGSTKGLGGIDVLLVPDGSTKKALRLDVAGAWSDFTVGIEIKAAHLGDGESGYKNALFNDLTLKPQQAAEAGHPCVHWLGLLITTDGMWSDMPETTQSLAQERGDRLSGRALVAKAPLYCFGATEPVVLQYQEWKGRVWVQVFAPNETQLGPPTEGV